MPRFGRPSERDDQRARDWRDWLRRRNPLAVASFVLGCLSLTHAGLLLVDAVASIVLGLVALNQLRGAVEPASVEAAAAEPALPEPVEEARADELLVSKTRGRRLAWAGIALGSLSLAAALVLYLAPWRH